MQRRLLTALTVALASSASAYEVELVENNGPSANRIDVAILGDGYTASEQATFRADAVALISGMYSVSPYVEYRQLFNFHLVKVTSNQSGADYATGTSKDPADVRDTALGAYFWCSGIERLLCVSDATVLNVANAHVPQHDLIIVLVNSTKYGGAGGRVATVSKDPKAKQVVQHEAAHTLSNLADEYESAYPGYSVCSGDCPEPNATLVTDRTRLKWASWVDSATPVPTPETTTYATAVGVFEGARYMTTGVYRPWRAGCMMREFTTLKFCAVCAEAMVRSFWRRASPIDSAAPAASSVLGCGTVRLEAHPPPVNTTWSRLWTIDGKPQTGDDVLSLAPGTLPAGAHTVTFTLQDATPFVRNDPEGLLAESRSWTVTSCGTYACDGTGAACRTTCADDTHCASGHACQSGACVSTGPGPVDAGTPDAGTPDAGTPDAGPGAGMPDAGTGTPGGASPDGGTPTTDVGGNPAGARAPGCSTSGAEPGLMGLVAVALLQALRRRRS